MNRSILLIALFAISPQLRAGAGDNADEEFYTERPMFQFRPNPTSERYFGGIGTTGLKARNYPGVVLIRDVRKDLSAPQMPFVIGVMGIAGEKADAQMSIFRQAMAAPASMPEFNSNVAAVETAPFWADTLAAIDEKHQKVQQMRSARDNNSKEHANADGNMTDEQKNEIMKKYEADLISPKETAIWKRGASNFGYHYLGCAKTFAQMGKAFADANFKMMKKP
jgi:hypothetical protein